MNKEMTDPFPEKILTESVSSSEAQTKICNANTSETIRGSVSR